MQHHFSKNIEPVFDKRFLLGKRPRSVIMVQYKDASMNTELTGADLELLENQLCETEEKLQEVQVKDLLQ